MTHRFVTLLLVATLTVPAFAHVNGYPSIHDVMADVIARMKTELSADELRRLRHEDAAAFLTEAEKAALGEAYWTFKVDQPVTVWVFRDTRQEELPAWLEGRGFTMTDQRATVDGGEFEGWRKEFDAGIVGLGYNGLREHEMHYFVVLTPQEEGAAIKVSDLYPGRHTAGTFEKGAIVLADEEDARVEALPKMLDGQTLLRGLESRAEETSLVGVWRTTDYPATAMPDQVVLTWSEDPRLTQTIQWRTDTTVENGFVRFHEVSSRSQEDAFAMRDVAATWHTLEDPFLVNDSVNHRFSATLRDLKPSTTYTYQVGDDDTVTKWASFTTAPAGPVPFKFVYMGDAQNGLDTWGNLVHHAHATQPDAAFYIMAGDLVNRGNERDDWDRFFHNSAGVYDHKQLVPAIGNHEDQGDDGPWMYLNAFTLPENGPEKIAKERAYSYTYSNALFVVLDTNDSIADQTAWLEEQLSGSDATWKFLVYHHPAYSSGASRDNPQVRKEWGALCDKYHVDMALQGHDHAYLRTWPMRDEQRVASPGEGTIYIVSVSGTKHYPQGDFAYTEFGMTNVATYQVLDITIDGNTLAYKAYDGEGKIRDSFEIVK